jgi:hypothetical protein
LLWTEGNAQNIERKCVLPRRIVEANADTLPFLRATWKPFGSVL